MTIDKQREDLATICKRTLHTPQGDLTQTTKLIDNVHTTWQIEHWCKSIEDVDRALSIPYVPVEHDVSDYHRIKKKVARECTASAKEGGGYVIMPTAAPINSPLQKKTEENYLRFINAALE